ncbi:hypothetical protein V8E36_004966 [Tilletia maclaganii]
MLIPRGGRLRVLGLVAAGSVLILFVLFISTSSTSHSLSSTTARLRQHLPNWVFPQPAASPSPSTAAAAAAASPSPSAKSPIVKVPAWMLPPEDKPEEPDVLVFPPNPPNLPALLPAEITSSSQLKERLQRFLDAPAPSRSTAYMQNLLSCSRSIFQANDDQVHLNHQFWLSDTHYGPNSLRLWRSRLVRALERAERKGAKLVAQPGEPLEGSKGLVYAPRNAQDAEDVLTSLRWLRNHLKSTIEVEIWYSAASSSHLNLAESRYKTLTVALTALKATARALPPHVNARTEGFASARRAPHIRAAAMLESSFIKVLYLDPSALPLQDPLALFTSKPFLMDYKSPPAGVSTTTTSKEAPASPAAAPPPTYTPNAVLWPSIHRDSNENPIWRFVGSPCVSDHWQIDAGQMLIDKRGNGGLNLAVLHIAAYMQDISGPVGGPGVEAKEAVTVEAQLDGRGGAPFFTRLSADGQEALRYAFMVLGLNYTPAPVWPSVAGNMVNAAQEQQQQQQQGGKSRQAVVGRAPAADSSFCGHALVHFDLETEPYRAPASASKSWLRRRRTPAPLIDARSPAPASVSASNSNDASPLFLHLNLTRAFLAAHPQTPQAELFTHLQSFAPNKLGDRAFEEVSAGVTTHITKVSRSGAAEEEEYGCLRMKTHEDPYTRLLDQEREKMGLGRAKIELMSVVELVRGSQGAPVGDVRRAWAGIPGWIEAYWAAASSGIKVSS